MGYLELTCQYPGELARYEMSKVTRVKAEVTRSRDGSPGQPRDGNIRYREVTDVEGSPGAVNVSDVDFDLSQ